MRIKSTWFSLQILFLFALSCKQQQPHSLFTEIPSAQSRIDFTNAIKEDKDYNILTYEYLYNGGV
jgi:hypothetical protein